MPPLHTLKHSAACNDSSRNDSIRSLELKHKRIETRSQYRHQQPHSTPEMVEFVLQPEHGDIPLLVVLTVFANFWAAFNVSGAGEKFGIEDFCGHKEVRPDDSTHTPMNEVIMSGTSSCCANVARM